MPLAHSQLCVRFPSDVHILFDALVLSVLVVAFLLRLVMPRQLVY